MFSKQSTSQMNMEIGCKELLQKTWHVSTHVFGGFTEKGRNKHQENGYSMASFISRDIKTLEINHSTPQKNFILQPIPPALSNTSMEPYQKGHSQRSEGEVLACQTATNWWQAKSFESSTQKKEKKKAYVCVVYPYHSQLIAFLSFLVSIMWIHIKKNCWNKS